MKTTTIASKEELNLKIKKSSRIATVLARITAIVGIIGSIFALFLMVMVIVDDSAFTTLMPTGMTVDTMDGYLIQTPGDYIAGFTNGIAQFLIYSACAFLVAGIFKRISEDGLPFKEENTKSLKIIGILIIAASIVPSILAQIAGVLAGPITTVMVTFNLDTAMIGALFFMIATIFSYGAKLQQENDDMV